MITTDDIQPNGEDVENRRRRRRLLCSDLITVYWASGRGFARHETAVLEDYSAAGASLFVSTRLEPGLALTIRTESESFGAMVRHCVWRDHGYLLGVEFDQLRPDADLYTPAHLLDPEELGIG